MKNAPAHARATYQHRKPTFLGLSSTEWVRLNMFLALVLLSVVGWVILPSLVGGN